ncbi:uncharacterized protein [Diadema setosum]|uniref:uncharacterized protein n=1 Tax=Diadema setosum TaxID=31175 RepID=UPI003B3A3672
MDRMDKPLVVLGCTLFGGLDIIAAIGLVTVGVYATLEEGIVFSLKTPLWIGGAIFVGGALIVGIALCGTHSYKKNLTMLVVSGVASVLCSAGVMMLEFAEKAVIFESSGPSLIGDRDFEAEEIVWPSFYIIYLVCLVSNVIGLVSSVLGFLYIYCLLVAPFRRQEWKAYQSPDKNNELSKPAKTRYSFKHSKLLQKEGGEMRCVEEESEIPQTSWIYDTDGAEPPPRPPLVRQKTQLDKAVVEELQHHSTFVEHQHQTHALSTPPPPATPPAPPPPPLLRSSLTSHDGSSNDLERNNQQRSTARSLERYPIPRKYSGKRQGNLRRSLSGRASKNCHHGDPGQHHQTILTTETDGQYPQYISATTENRMDSAHRGDHGDDDATCQPMSRVHHRRSGRDQSSFYCHPMQHSPSIHGASDTRSHAASASHSKDDEGVDIETPTSSSREHFEKRCATYPARPAELSRRHTTPATKSQSFPNTAPQHQIGSDVHDGPRFSHQYTHQASAKHDGHQPPTPTQRKYTGKEPAVPKPLRHPPPDGELVPQHTPESGKWDHGIIRMFSATPVTHRGNGRSVVGGEGGQHHHHRDCGSSDERCWDAPSTSTQHRDPTWHHQKSFHAGEAAIVNPPAHHHGYHDNRRHQALHQLYRQEATYLDDEKHCPAETGRSVNAGGGDEVGRINQEMHEVTHERYYMDDGFHGNMNLPEHPAVVEQDDVDHLRPRLALSNTQVHVNPSQEYYVTSTRL